MRFRPKLAPALRGANAAAAKLIRQEAVFLGDSITRSWLESDPTFFLFRRLNKGVSGDTTELMLRRFDADVLAHRPPIVHIMGGTNDLWYGAPGEAAWGTVLNLTKMVGLAQAAGIRVVLASTPPVSTRGAALLAHADLLPTLQAAIRALCFETGVQHVDYAAALTDEAGEMRAQYTTDGIHLTRAGYRAIRRLATDALTRCLEDG